MTEPTDTAYRVIGARPVRPDAADKMTGAAVFGVDTKVPGMVPGLVLRSPHAYAKIKRIDTSKAEALEGVLAVVTARDVWPESEWTKESNAQLKLFRDNFLASDTVMHRGQPVAVIAALDRFIAEEAAALIEIDYEVMTPILDVLEAARPEAPVFHPLMQCDTMGPPAKAQGNICTHHRHLKGDPAAGLAMADVVIEREFRTATTHQGYLEPHVSVAAWGPDGMLTIWADTQFHFLVRDDTAKFNAVPISKVRVIPMEVGGGFGGKGICHLDPLAAAIARKAKRPVRLVMTRKETFDATGPSPASYMKVKIGARRDGKITAMVAEIYFDAGAYPEPGVIGTALTCTFAPYETPHGQLDGYEVIVNKPRHTAYRAPGAQQTMFAAETAIDELAEQLGMDPLEFRLKNIAHEGTVQITGVVVPPVAYEQTLRRAMEHPHYKAPLGGPNRGRGVAAGWWPNFGLPSCATIQVSPDGSVNMATGSVDLQGNRTSLAMQAAETLGVDVSVVHPLVADTDSVGWTSTTGGSRVTFATGIAVIQAATAALKEMCARAAKIWGVPAETVSASGGVFTTTADKGKRLTFKEVAQRFMGTGGPVFTSAAVDSGGAGAGPAIGLQIADVEVDLETGQTKVLRYTAFQDVGTAIHPGLVEGQIQGGVVQGIGWALWEGFKYDAEGRMVNHSFLDYKMPTALDVPMVDCVLVEDVPNPAHPYGVRGVGETPIVPPPAVLANAIYRAAGVRMHSLPMTPDRVLEEMGVIE